MRGAELNPRLLALLEPDGAPAQGEPSLLPLPELEHEDGPERDEDWTAEVRSGVS